MPIGTENNHSKQTEINWFIPISFIILQTEKELFLKTTDCI